MSEIANDTVGATDNRRARFIPTPERDAEGTREFIACHRLAEAILPSHRLRLLLEAADGIPSVALGFSQEKLQSPTLGLTEKQIIRITDARNAVLDPRLLDRALGSGTYAMTFLDPAYPAGLLPLTDSPPLIFVRGELLPDDRFSIAIVGTRRATNYGREQAARFGRVFAEHNLVVVSGGAAGIDAAAHQGVLSVGGRTIAVLGCGVDISYPAENRAMFAKIANEGRGALISEFPLGTKPEPWRFPTRNRIIAGIARASLLVETPDASGALGTARCSVEYGRDVYVVPGPVDTGRSRGGHRLIRDGAIIADSPEDVMESLGVVLAAQESVTLEVPSQQPRATRTSATRKTAVSPVPAAPTTPVPVAAAPLPNLSDDEAKLLAVLDLTPKHLDDASAQAGLSASQATVAATLLEMKNLVRRLPGNLFTRAL